MDLSMYDRPDIPENGKASRLATRWAEETAETETETNAGAVGPVDVDGADIVSSHSFWAVATFQNGQGFQVPRLVNLAKTGKVGTNRSDRTSHPSLPFT